MSINKTYVLIYDSDSERLAMYGDDETIPLHCGDCIEVQRVIITEDSKDVWIPTRVEADVNDEWYLDGLYNPGEIPRSLAVRFPS